MHLFGMKTPRDKELRREGARQNLAKLKKFMHKRFLLDNYKHDLYMSISSLNQDWMSVEEYIHEFRQLQIHSGLEEEEQQTMVRSLSGFIPNLFAKVELQPCWSFKDIC